MITMTTNFSTDTVSTEYIHLGVSAKRKELYYYVGYIGWVAIINLHAVIVSVTG